MERRWPVSPLSGGCKIKSTAAPPPLRNEMQTKSIVFLPLLPDYLLPNYAPAPIEKKQKVHNIYKYNLKR